MFILNSHSHKLPPTVPYKAKTTDLEGSTRSSRPACPSRHLCIFLPPPNVEPGTPRPDLGENTLGILYFTKHLTVFNGLSPMCSQPHETNGSRIPALTTTPCDFEHVIFPFWGSVFLAAKWEYISQDKLSYTTYQAPSQCPDTTKIYFLLTVNIHKEPVRGTALQSHHHRIAAPSGKQGRHVHTARGELSQSWHTGLPLVFYWPEAVTWPCLTPKEPINIRKQMEYLVSNTVSATRCDNNTSYIGDYKD